MLCVCMHSHVVYTSPIYVCVCVCGRYSREIKLLYSQWSEIYWTEGVQREVIKLHLLQYLA